MRSDNGLDKLGKPRLVGRGKTRFGIKDEALETGIHVRTIAEGGRGRKSHGPDNRLARRAGGVRAVGRVTLEKRCV